MKVLKRVVDTLHSAAHVLMGPNRAPVRKVVAGAAAAALVFLAHLIGLHIPVKALDDLAASFAGIVVAYIAKS